MQLPLGQGLEEQGGEGPEECGVEGLDDELGAGDLSKED